MMNNEAWELFVGQLTPEEFTKGFSSPGKAIDALMNEAWWEDGSGQSAPEDLADLLKEYISEN